LFGSAALAAGPGGFLAFGGDPGSSGACFGDRGRYGGGLFGCGGLALGDDRDEEGQSLDEAPDLILHLRDHPLGNEPAGPRRDGPEQGNQGDSEALGRGKEWDVVHTLFLHQPGRRGQAEKSLVLR
jgi:hypothetical protein